MNTLYASIGAAVAAILGTIGWAAISYGLNYEIGLVAWAIGGLVGLATRLGARNETGVHLGAIAAVFALLSVGLGKYTAAYLAVEHHFSNIAAEIQTKGTPDEAKYHLAIDLIEERTSAGKKVNWKPGMNLENASELQDLPEDIRIEADKKWTGLSEEKKQEQLAAIEKSKEAFAQVLMTSDMKQSMIFESLKESIHPLDLLFFGLAIFTAFRLGSGGQES